MADLLKEMDIPFVDTVGNAYINEPPLLIFLQGNKPVDKFREKPTARAFQPTGLQLIFAFLCNPGLENAPFREIAKTADLIFKDAKYVSVESETNYYDVSG